jgi:hypothetical protein
MFFFRIRIRKLAASGYNAACYINGTYMHIVLDAKSLEQNSVKPIIYSVILLKTTASVFMLSFCDDTITLFNMPFVLFFSLWPAV